MVIHSLNLLILHHLLNYILNLYLIILFLFLTFNLHIELLYNKRRNYDQILLKYIWKSLVQAMGSIYRQSNYQKRRILKKIILRIHQPLLQWVLLIRKALTFAKSSAIFVIHLLFAITITRSFWLISMQLPRSPYILDF